MKRVFYVAAFGLVMMVLALGAKGNFVANANDCFGDKQAVTSQYAVREFAGTIAGQGVYVELTEVDGELSGSYYYTKYGPNNRIYLYGEIDYSRNFELTGYNEQGVKCDKWIGTMKNGVIKAAFVNVKTKRTYNFTLVQVR